jgi:hypothetical protein
VYARVLEGDVEQVDRFRGREQSVRDSS